MGAQVGPPARRSSPPCLAPFILEHLQMVQLRAFPLKDSALPPSEGSTHSLETSGIRGLLLSLSLLSQSTSAPTDAVWPTEVPGSTLSGNSPLVCGISQELFFEKPIFISNHQIMRLGQGRWFLLSRFFCHNKSP